jgi:hypothetical protein
MLRRFRPYTAEFSKIPLLKTRGARWSVCCAVVVAGALAISVVGCGRIISQKATDQLIAGDAVDRTISQIDFRVLMGKKVFLDTQYINKTVPGVGFVNSEYMISSVRQKMMCDGCLLQEKTDDADFVVEMRIGALGADGHEVIYGMPPNNYLSIAASVVPASPQAAAVIPSMPELSLAKKDDQMAAAKIALFAYNRHTREPIWQSGISESRSLVADRWFFGAGPYHKGNIYGTKKQPDEPSMFGSMEDEEPTKEYFVERRFADPNKSLADAPPATKPAAAAAPAAAPATTPATTATPAAAAPAAPTAAAATTNVATPPVAAAQPAAANVVNSSPPPADPGKGTATSAVPASTTGAPAAPTKTTALPAIATPTTGSVSPPAGTPTQPAQTVSSSSP